MKTIPQQFTLFILVVGLAAVTIIEALRPGTVGAAANLGVVILLAGTLLGLGVKKSPPSDSKGERRKF